MNADSAPAPPPVPRQYRIAGLAVHSEIALPIAEDVSGDADVFVRDEGTLPSGQTSASDRRLEAEGGEHEIRLRWRGLGTMTVDSGARIGLAREAGVTSAEVAPLVLGVGMGLILHQRGWMVLHASGVTQRDGVVAFVGMKEAGKSTMAGAMVARGASVVSDDALPVSLGDGSAMAWPGPSALKLWPESLTAIGRSARGNPRLHPRASKRVLSDVPVTGEARPLRAIYALDISDDLGIEPILGQAALVELVRHSYAARFLPELGATPGHFERCATLAREVPLFRLSRPAALDKLDDVAALVEAHAAGLD
jgi:hypothetical protein